MEDRFIIEGTNFAKHLCVDNNMYLTEEFKDFCINHKYLWFCAECAEDFNKTLREQQKLANKLGDYIEEHRNEAVDGDTGVEMAPEMKVLFDFNEHSTSCPFKVDEVITPKRGGFWGSEHGKPHRVVHVLEHPGFYIMGWNKPLYVYNMVVTEVGNDGMVRTWAMHSDHFEKWEGYNVKV